MWSFADIVIFLVVWTLFTYCAITQSPNKKAPLPYLIAGLTMAMFVASVTYSGVAG